MIIIISVIFPGHTREDPAAPAACPGISAQFHSTYYQYDCQLRQLRNGRQIGIHDTDNGQKDFLPYKLPLDRHHSQPKIANCCHPEWPFLGANCSSQGIHPSRTQASYVFKTYKKKYISTNTISYSYHTCYLKQFRDLKN